MYFDILPISNVDHIISFDDISYTHVLKIPLVLMT